MRRMIDWSWKALIVLACVAYQILVHIWVTGAQGGELRAVLLWLPLVVFTGWVMARARNKATWLAGLFAASVLVYLAENQERLGLAAVSGISHATAYLFLLWYFARTLARGSEPIITRLARRVHGALPPQIVAFTRSVTIAWCVFFGAQISVSLLLVVFAPLEIWSLFVNLINVPLLALMFGAEYVYRAIRFPDRPRASIARVLRAFAEEASVSVGSKAR